MIDKKQVTRARANAAEKKAQADAARLELKGHAASRLAIWTGADTAEKQALREDYKKADAACKDAREAYDVARRYRDALEYHYCAQAAAIILEALADTPAAIGAPVRYKAVKKAVEKAAESVDGVQACIYSSYYSDGLKVSFVVDVDDVYTRCNPEIAFEVWPGCICEDHNYSSEDWTLSASKMKEKAAAIREAIPAPRDIAKAAKAVSGVEKAFEEKRRALEAFEAAQKAKTAALAPKDRTSSHFTLNR